jgi:phenylacetate-coenzyme A ligase PaaK-like adenylate-forming protein
MPLLRYEVNDVIEIKHHPEPCACGRAFPQCEKITGRIQDIITTPDRRLLSNLFLLFDTLEHSLLGQIIQEDVETLRVKLIPAQTASSNGEKRFFHRLQRVVGNQMKVVAEYTTWEKLNKTNERNKYKPIISHVKPAL